MPSTIADALAGAFSVLPESLAVGVVDLRARALVVIRASEPCSLEGLERVATQAAELFEDTETALTVSAADPRRPDAPGLEVVLIRRHGLVLIFARAGPNATQAAVFIARQLPSLELGSPLLEQTVSALDQSLGMAEPEQG
jgi:hypothetical protein